MGPKDEASAKPAEIGNALVEALGFEPAEGRKLGRSAVAEVSDQISEVGFSVTDTFGDEGDMSGDSGDSGDTSTDISDDEAEATIDFTDEEGLGNELLPDARNGSKRSKKLDGAADEDRDVGDLDLDREYDHRGQDDSSDGLKAEADARLKEIIDGDPNDTVVVPGPPDENVIAAKAGAGISGKDKDDLVESLVSAGTLAGAGAPTGPPLADSPGDPDTDGSTSGGPNGNRAGMAPGAVQARADTTIPSGPAVTGEYPMFEVASPKAEPVRQVVITDARSVIDKPRSISDMFSGGITGRRRLQARKVRRVIRHIDPWSVLTFSVLFHLCLFAALLLASVLVWNVAEEAGTIENIESFIQELGDYETFEIDGEAIFRAAVAIAGIMTLAASVLVVLLTVMFNLLSDLLGGIRITVIEEETLRVKPKKDE
ncbi:MAG: DUF3566 domain-containing protein [Acidimicrobiia bacterium]|nr:DUF3566 domain-containing protein [Acidimicrobiia bacterium]